MRDVPRYVWVLLAVFLVCGAAEHLVMSGIYGLDLKFRLVHGDR